LAAEYYHYLLMEHALGDPARQYLKQRGLTPTTVKAYLLGFAPNSWQSLTDYLAKKGFKPGELAEAGLTSQGQRGSDYDRFRNRLMFPVQDAMGRVVGFSGRSLTNDDKGPKYLNTGETPIFHKGKLLYGLMQARDAIRDKRRIVFVEGNVDVLASWQAGIKEVVAPLGTAVTEEQVSLAKRFAENVYLGFDTDQAGQTATMRAVELLKQQQLDIRVIALKAGKDPDECIQISPEAWSQSVQEAREVFDFYLHWAATNYNLQSERGKRQAGELLMPLLKVTTDPVSRSFLVQKAAHALGVEEQVIQEQLTDPPALSQYAKPAVRSAQATAKPTRPRDQVLVEYLLSTILSAPTEDIASINVAEELGHLLPQALPLEVYRRIVDAIVKTYQPTTAVDLTRIVEHLNPDDMPTFDVLSLTDPGNIGTSINYPALLRQVIRELNSLYLKQELGRVSLALKQAEALGQGDAMSLKRQFADLMVKLAQLEQG
jgi:DNA primase